MASSRSRPSVSIKVLKDTDDFAEISMSSDLITMLMKYPRSENGKSDYTDSPVIKKAKQDMIAKATHPTEIGLLTNALHKSVRKKKAKTNADNSSSTCSSNETIHSTHFPSGEATQQSGNNNPAIDISSKSIPDHMKLIDNTNSVKLRLDNARGIKDVHELKTSVLNCQIYQLDTGSTGEKVSVRECSDACVYPVMSASSKTVINAYSETLEFQKAVIADDILTSFCAQKENNPVLLYTSDVSALLDVHKKSMPVVLDAKALKLPKEPILKCTATVDMFKPPQIDRKVTQFLAKVQDFSKPQVDHKERGPLKPHMEHVDKETSLLNSATLQLPKMKCKTISQNTIAVSKSSLGLKKNNLVSSQASKSLGRSKNKMERKSVNPPSQLEPSESSTIDLNTSLEILGKHEQKSYANSYTSLNKSGKNSSIHLSKTHKKRKHSVCDEKNVWKSDTSHRKIVCSDDSDLIKERNSYNTQKESILKISQNESISELPITNNQKKMDLKVKEISRPNRKRIGPVISISDDNSKSSFIDLKSGSVSSEREFKFNSIPQKQIKLTASSSNDSHSSKSHNQNSSFVSDADSHFTLYAKNIFKSSDSISVSSSNKEKKSVISKADSFKSSKNLNEKKQTFSKTSKSIIGHRESKPNAFNGLDVSLSHTSHEESKIVSLKADDSSISFKAHRKRKYNSSCKEDRKDLSLCTADNFHSSSIHEESKNNAANFEFPHQEYKKNKIYTVENISNTNINLDSNVVEMHTLEVTETCITSGSDNMSHLVNNVNSSNVINTEGSSNLEDTNDVNIILNTEKISYLKSAETVDLASNAEDNSDCKTTENVTIASNRKNISRLETRENRTINVSNIQDSSSPTLNALLILQYSVESRSLQPPTQPEWISKPLPHNNPQCSHETDLKETSTLSIPPKTSQKQKDLQLVSMKSQKESAHFTLDPSDIVKSFETQLEQLQMSPSVTLKSNDSKRFTESTTSTVNSTPDNSSKTLAEKTSFCSKRTLGLSQPFKRQTSLAADTRSNRVLRPRKAKVGLSDVLTKSTAVPSNSSYLSFGHQEHQSSGSYPSFNLLLSVISKISNTHKIEQQNNLENTFSNVKESSALSDSIPIALVGSTTLDSDTPESDAVTALLSLRSVSQQDAIVPQNVQILTEQGNPLHDTDEDIIKSDTFNSLSSDSRGRLVDRSGQSLLSYCPLLDSRELLVQESGSISRNSEAERTLINTNFRDDAYKTNENTFLTTISCASPDKLNNIVRSVSVPLCFSNYQPSTPGDKLSLVEPNFSDFSLLDKPRSHKRENVLIQGETSQEINTLELNTTMHPSSVNRHDLTQIATASNGLNQYSNNTLPNIVKTHNIATQDDNTVSKKSSRMKIPNVIILSSSSSRSQESAHPGLIKSIGSYILQPEKVIVRHEGKKRSVIVLPCDDQRSAVSIKLTEILKKTTFIQPSINSDNVVNVYDVSNDSTSLHVSKYCLETMNLCSHPNQKDVDDRTLKTLTGTNNDVTGVPVTPLMCIVPPYVNSSADTPYSPDVEFSEKNLSKSDRFTLLHPQVDSEMQQALLSRLVKQDQSYQERNGRQSHDLANITGVFKEKSVKHWTYKEVESWFYANGLEKALPLIGDKNSKTLMELKTLQKSRPKEFFKKAGVYRNVLPLEKLLQFSKILREMAADTEKCPTLES
ncbi:hypothetical protein Bpfe_014999 [Biomphalaria pfeifferi]|uniref:Uncharacterized protein n=1 Tax=Biomphalaria pfeifferi TaxID=112525 RepID=A0AAD8F9C4_BIOPF|nr:hypothetical protein Bpfe_014999 [Biomphalaria pfeifferi]